MWRCTEVATDADAAVLGIVGLIVVSPRGDVACSIAMDLKALQCARGSLHTGADAHGETGPSRASGTSASQWGQRGAGPNTHGQRGVQQI